MGKLNINVKELTKHIELKTDYWINKETTNCYAYAMGFDIPEYAIRNNAYCVGTIGLTTKGISIWRIKDFSYNERLLMDLKALKLKYQEVDIDEEIKDDNRNSYFLISLLESNRDFHFLRKDKKTNIWWHKRGWYNEPCFVDDYLRSITNPKEATIGHYRYVKTYKIGYKHF